APGSSSGTRPRPLARRSVLARRRSSSRGRRWPWFEAPVVAASTSSRVRGGLPVGIAASASWSAPAPMLSSLVGCPATPDGSKVAPDQQLSLQSGRNVIDELLDEPDKTFALRKGVIRRTAGRIRFPVP